MSTRRRALHLLALSSFAVAQPLFAKLGPAPGYFAAHHLHGSEIVAFALAALLLPPLVLIGIEALAGIAGTGLADGLHLVFVAVLIGLIALPPLGSLPTAAAYAGAALIGVAGAWAYARRRAARSFTSALAPAPALFLIAFAFSPSGGVALGNGSAWRAGHSYRPPVVFLQFDALPSLLLETPQHTIDAARYPNFARLAHDGTWYRNASNVHENTVFSVPSIADGNIPHKGITPVVQDHPQNLFTLLGPGYRMNVAEEATSLCPVQYCRRTPEHPGIGARARSMVRDTYTVFNQIVRPVHARASLPSIRHRWSHFSAGPLPTGFQTVKKTPDFVLRHLRSGRIGRFEHWLGRIGRGGGSQPELDYIHAFLPHEPREFLPDGRRYVTPDDGLGGPPSYDKPFLSLQQEQRVQLQLGYTDRVVGTVIAKLKRLGIYDDALIVVVADHGESFDTKPTPAGPFVPGHLGYRRAVTPRNLADIASIPMFIKYPEGHGPSGIDDRFVRDVDIFPTIAKTIGLPLAPVSGTPLQQPGYRGHSEVQVGTTFDGIVRAGSARWQAERQASLERRLRTFGSGSRSLYAFGPQGGLVGRAVSDLTVLPRGRVRATLDQAGQFRRVDPSAAVCPCQLAGRIRGADPQSITIAVAVNGRIAATGQGFQAVGVKRVQWSVMVPPSAFRRGRNDVVVYRTEAGQLTPLGGS
ncbi:MAG: hypothetical protein QOH13_845 [Thermoleophilaceae bacterium]|nr:hypothetical protein [Thermoleophilaceae bacterium]